MSSYEYIFTSLQMYDGLQEISLYTSPKNEPLSTAKYERVFGNCRARKARYEPGLARLDESFEQWN